MAKTTYKDLFQLVRKEISSALGVEQGLSNSQVQKAGSGAGSADRLTAGVSGLLQSLMESVELLAPPRVIEGLEVTAKSNPSNKVMIAPGKGIAYGRVYEVLEDTEVEIVMDNTADVYYINLYLDNIYVETATDSKKLTIAKIVVPFPGYSKRIVDTRNGIDAYIVNLKQLPIYWDGKEKIEEDTLEVLRSNMDELLADNLVGEINLSEHLTITNAQNSIEMDSKELRIKSDDSVVAKFNRDGIYFFDNDGRELAKFATDGARIGNIEITPDSLESTDFYPGINGKGFQIKADGSAQFNNVLVRGELRSVVFKQNEVSVANGDLIVTAGSVLDEDIDDSTTTVKVRDAVFANDDIIYFNNAEQYEYMKVTGGGGTNTLTVQRNLVGTAASSYAWSKSSPIAKMGDRIALICSGDDAENVPYIELVKRTGVGISDEDVRCRIGNLNGVVDEDYGALTGFGLYATNVFLKGALYAPDIKTGITGARVELTETDNCLRAFDAVRERVRLGDLGDGTYGLRLTDESGNITLEAGKQLKQQYMKIDGITIYKPFIPLFQVTTDSGMPHAYSPSAKIGANSSYGRMLNVCYSYGWSTNDSIAVKQVASGGEFSTAQSIVFAPGSGRKLREPSMAHDKDFSYVYWAWIDQPSTTGVDAGTIYLGRTTNAFGSPTSASTGITGCRPRIAVDTLGNIHMVYTVMDDMTYGKVYYARFNSSFVQQGSSVLLFSSLTFDASADIIDNIVEAQYNAVPAGKTEKLSIVGTMPDSGFVRLGFAQVDTNGTVTVSEKMIFTDYPPAGANAEYVTYPRITCERHDVDNIQIIFVSSTLGGGDCFRHAKITVDGTEIVYPHMVGSGVPWQPDSVALGAALYGRLWIVEMLASDGGENVHCMAYRKESLTDKNLENLFNFVS
jgi:hypothetical protein